MAQKVDPKLADGCVEKYKSLYQSDDLASIKNAYTEMVTFPLDSIKQYVAGSAAADALAIKFGVYTKEFATQYKTIEGRLAVFLYTKTGVYGGGYGDDPQDPLNIADSTPPSYS